MKQLTCLGPGRLEWLEIREPEVEEPDDVLVRPIVVARCEIDPLLATAGPTRGPQFALGHEAVAQVVAVGDDVSHVVAGDLVVPSFQLSCGRCTTCRRGRSAVCDAYPTLSDYGMEPLSGMEYGGMLSDLVRVPHASTMLAPVPQGISPLALASAADNLLDGYRAVAPHLTRRPGSTIAVVCHGLRSIGLYAAHAAVALGASDVAVVTVDGDVAAAADGLGARMVVPDFGQRPLERWPIVVDCGTDVGALQWAIRATEPEGVFQSVSSYLEGSVPLPLGRLYTLGIELHIGRVHSASGVAEVVAAIEAGVLMPLSVPTDVVPWDQAAERFLQPGIKVIFDRSSTPDLDVTIA
jgi:alcohol dehydrogenase